MKVSTRVRVRGKIVLLLFSILAIFIFIWLMLFYETRFPYFSIRDNPSLFLLGFLFLYLTDNLRIYYEGPLGKPKDEHFKIRVITNIIGFMPILVLFGPKVSNVLMLIVRFLRVNEEKKDTLFLRKLRGTVHYFTYYSIGSIVYDLLITKNFFLAMALFILISRVLNILMLHAENPKYPPILRKFHEVLNDIPLFFANLPALYLFGMMFNLLNHRVLLMALGYYFLSVSLLLYWLFLRYKSNYANSQVEHERLLSVKEGIENVLKVFKMIKSTKPPEEFLMDIARIVGEYLGYRYVLISIFNDEEGIAERVAYYGFDEHEFKRLKDNPPQIDEVKELLRPEFKISNSYFIPEGAIGRLDEEKVFIGEYGAFDGKNTWKPLDILIVPFYDRNGLMVGYISPDGPLDNKRPTIEKLEILEIFVEQIVSFLEESREFADVLKKSVTDGLTGLYNHSYFYSYLRKKLSSLEDEEVSIILLDLDDFKQINDTYGHSFGDHILREIAQLIKSSIRNTDIACRYGGDEFVIVLPGMSKQAAKEVAERLLNGFKNAKFEKGVMLTTSIGIATFPEDGKDVDELFEKADNALYISKNLGKNTITE